MWIDNLTVKRIIGTTATSTTINQIPNKDSENCDWSTSCFCGVFFFKFPIAVEIIVRKDNIFLWCRSREYWASIINSIGNYS